MQLQQKAIRSVRRIQPSQSKCPDTTTPATTTSATSADTEEMQRDTFHVKERRNAMTDAAMSAPAKNQRHIPASAFLAHSHQFAASQ